MPRISSFLVSSVIALAAVAGKNVRTFEVDAFVVVADVRTPAMMSARGRQRHEQQIKNKIGILHPLLSSSSSSEGDNHATKNTIPSTNDRRQQKQQQQQQQGEEEDTIRIRIWKVLASSIGKEISLKELGSKVGERNRSELLSHLKHVEKQSKTLQNKKIEWKIRRGLMMQSPTASQASSSPAPTTTTTPTCRRSQKERDVNKLRLEIIRRGKKKKKETYIKLS